MNLHYNDLIVNDKYDTHPINITPNINEGIIRYSAVNLPSYLSINSSTGNITGTVHRSVQCLDIIVTVTGYGENNSSIESTFRLYVNFMGIVYDPNSCYVYHGQTTNYKVTRLQGLYDNVLVNTNNNDLTLLLQNQINSSTCLFNTTIPDTIPEGNYQIQITLINNEFPNLTNGSDTCYLYVYNIPEISYQNLITNRSEYISLSPTTKISSNNETITGYTLTGSLPEGLTFDSSTGNISGTINTSATFGKYNLTVTMNTKIGNDNNININTMFNIIVKNTTITRFICFLK